MANDFNQVTMTGRLGKDPEIRRTNSGDTVANFTLAVGETWKDKSGDRKEKTEWVNVTVWGGLAGIVENYLKKGSKVLIQGKFQTRKWQNKDGKDQYTTEVVLQGFSAFLQMLDGKPSEQREERPASRQEQSYAPQESDGIPF